MQSHSLIHVRCGTAFLLWVMVVAIVVFVALGTPDEWYWLVLSRVLPFSADRRASPTR